MYTSWDQRTDKSISLEQYVNDYYNELDIGQTELAMLESILQNSPLTAIMKLDFDAIAGGTSSDTVYNSFMTYMNLLGGEAAEKAVEIWEALKEANFTPLEEALGIKVSDSVKKSSAQA